MTMTQKCSVVASIHNSSNFSLKINSMHWHIINILPHNIYNDVSPLILWPWNIRALVIFALLNCINSINKTPRIICKNEKTSWLYLFPPRFAYDISAHTRHSWLWHQCSHAILLTVTSKTTLLHHYINPNCTKSYKLVQKLPPQIIK